MNHVLLKRRIAKLFNTVEHDPHFQFQFHRWMLYFWIVNGVLALFMFLFLPELWTKASLLYVLLVSLYANADTDYDAMSASGAWMEAKKGNER